MNFENLKSLHIPEGRVISIAINGVKVFKTKGEVTKKPTPLHLTCNNKDQELVSAGSGTGVLYYSLDNATWSPSLPKAKNPGTYTVYYYAGSSEDYKRSDVGSVRCTIENGICELTLSATKGTLTYPTTSLTFTVLKNTSGGTLSVASSNDEIATASIRGNVITVNWVSPGEATITVTSAATDTYNAGTATIHVTVAKGKANLSMVTSATGSVGGQTTIEFTTDSDGKPEITVENTGIALVSLKEFSTVVNPPVPKEDLIYIGEPLELISEGSGSTAMEYKLNNGEWSTEIPTATEPGTYTVYYRTISTGDHTAGTVMSLTVTIVDVPTDEGINLPNRIEIVNNRSVSIPITTDTEGTLTVRSHNDDVITSDITDNNVLNLHAITLGTSLVIVALHDENGTIVAAKKINVTSVESTTYNSYSDMIWNDVSLYTWDEM